MSLSNCITLYDKKNGSKTLTCRQIGVAFGINEFCFPLSVDQLQSTDYTHHYPNIQLRNSYNIT